MKDVLYSCYDEVPFYRKRWFGVLMFLLFLPVLIILCFTGGIYREKNGQAEKYLGKFAGLFFTVILFVGIIMVLVNAENDVVSVVKQSRLDMCKNKSIEQLVSNIISQPEWSAGVTDDGWTAVNAEGKVVKLPKEFLLGSHTPYMLIQFLLSKDKKSLTVYTVEVDKKPLPEMYIKSLLSGACQ